MRIISGKYKGRRLQAPKNLPVRPTTDMHKEALFNILANSMEIKELKVLDLFSGTGNVAYEFASRGSKSITAVDAHFGCIRYINKTAKELDLPIRTIKSDVFKFLSKTAEEYDLIFADPPYDLSIEHLTQLIDLIFSKELIVENGLFILEHTSQYDFSKHLNFKEIRKYGGTGFSFLG